MFVACAALQLAAPKRRVLQDDEPEDPIASPTARKGWVYEVCLMLVLLATTRMLAQCDSLRVHVPEIMRDHSLGSMPWTGVP